MGNGGDVRCPFHVKVFNINNNIINDTNTLKKRISRLKMVSPLMTVSVIHREGLLMSPAGQALRSRLLW